MRTVQKLHKIFVKVLVFGAEDQNKPLSGALWMNFCTNYIPDTTVIQFEKSSLIKGAPCSFLHF